MTVARREIVTKLTDRTFLLSTFGLIVILAGAVVGSWFLGRDDGPDVTRVAVAADAGALEPHLRSAAQDAGVQPGQWVAGDFIL